MANLILTIASEELLHRGKVILIKQYLKRCSSARTTYGFSIIGNQLSITPEFKTQDAFNRVETGISEILGYMCRELDNSGYGCLQHYNCCDCGGNNCDCSYCFSCNACDQCLAET